MGIIAEKEMKIKKRSGENRMNSAATLDNLTRNWKEQGRTKAEMCLMHISDVNRIRTDNFIMI